MPTRPSASPIWIATQDDLLKMTDAIAAEPLLAIDTESNSLYAYPSHLKPNLDRHTE